VEKHSNIPAIFIKVLFIFLFHLKESEGSIGKNERTESYNKTSLRLYPLWKIMQFHS
jgi:hypothetical protein